MKNDNNQRGGRDMSLTIRINCGCGFHHAGETHNFDKVLRWASSHNSEIGHTVEFHGEVSGEQEFSNRPTSNV